MKTPRYSHFFDEVWEEKGSCWKEVVGMAIIGAMLYAFVIEMVALKYPY